MVLAAARMCITPGFTDKGHRRSLLNCRGGSPFGSTKLTGFPPTYAYVLIPPANPMESDCVSPERPA